PNYFLADTYDWRIYHPVSLVYLRFPQIINASPELYMEYLVKRTPFYCLFNAFFMSLTGPFYYIFQITSITVNTLLFWITYLTAAKLFSKKTAVLSAALLPLIPMFAGRINFPITKPLVMFFILLTIYQYAKCRIFTDSLSFRRDQVLTVLAGVCAYMVHPMALFYLVWIALDQVVLWIRRKTPISFTFIFSAVCLITFMIIPWYAWSISTYGWESVFTPPAGIRESTHDAFSYLISRFTMIITSVFFPLPHSLTFFNIEGAPMDTVTQRWFSWGNYWLLNYFETWLFGFSLTSLPFGFWGFLKKKPDVFKLFSSPIVWLTCLGAGTVVGANLKIEAAQAFNMLGPLSVLVYIFVCHGLSRLSKRTLFLFWCCLFAENIVMRLLMFKMAKIYTRVADLVQHKDLPFLYDIVHSSFPHQLVISSMAVMITLGAYSYLFLRQNNFRSE
ncbi:MAG: hypothetical protein KC713_00960, partial [Candidatus Omnitrophica bacterium]|nr:hypothetical protein [Candidatus Omnitrophota bacterium]